MSLLQQFHKTLTALVLILVLATTAACSSTVQAKQPTNLPAISREYAQLNGETAQLDKIWQLGCPNS